MGDDVAVELTLPQSALVLLVGPSGAGKSTFAARRFTPTQIVSSDELRARVSDDSTDQDASADAFRILTLLVNGRLRRQLTTVVDATNLRAVNRRRLRSLAERYGVPVVAIVFDLPERQFFENNARRPDRLVSRDVVAYQVEFMRQAVADIPNEGYSAVYFVGREDS
jgi:predicted kinase